MNPSQPPRGRRRSWQRGLAATLLVAPLLASLLLRPGEGTGQLTGLLLLAEPLAIGLAGYLLLLLLARRWWLSSASLAIGTAAAVAVLHAPAATPVLADPEIPWAQQVSACARQNELPSAPLRLLSWNTSGATLDARTLERLVEQRPDVAVLSGLEDGAFLERLAEVLPGESLSFGSRGDQVGIYVRGVFEDCGEAAGAWPLTIFGPGLGPILADYALDHDDQEQLPDHHVARRTSGQLVFAFPRVQGVGTIPLVAYELPTASSRIGSRPWTHAVQDGSQTLAAAAALGGPSVVAVGHLGVPPSFQHTLAVLRSAGLHDAGGPPTWPARVRDLPSLPLYRMERVLSGSGWQASSAQTVDLPSPHRPLLVQLEHSGSDVPTPFGGE
jgi:hypothetical protein